VFQEHQAEPGRGEALGRFEGAFVNKRYSQLILVTACQS